MDELRSTAQESGRDEDGESVHSSCAGCSPTRVALECDYGLRDLEGGGVGNCTAWEWPCSEAETRQKHARVFCVNAERVSHGAVLEIMALIACACGGARAWQRTRKSSRDGKKSKVRRSRRCSWTAWQECNAGYSRAA
ncbi:hypothetical protein ERJ75_000366900 [Trypanosoma vivax]|nr:hypothetical protein ERJ75_000366900 [Trypanosoma vivax]